MCSIASSMRCLSRSKRAASPSSAATIRSSPRPSFTVMPAVDSNAARGTSTRSSTNWPAGTSSARRFARPPSSVTSPRTKTGCPQPRSMRPGSLERRRQGAEAGLPLVSPDLEVDVDDVVVGRGEAAQPVGDREGAHLGARAVVPDDAQPLAGDRRAEGPRVAGRAELGGGAGPVGDLALRDRHAVDRLAAYDGDLAEAAAEVAREVVGDSLLDEERAVRGDPHGDVSRRQRERFRGGLPCEREAGEQGERERAPHAR